ncbi:HAMP domain-containing protein [Gordonia sp. CPCC 205515]|uniref:HAMP domain-containing protein n=1 Tax=Gordonia sp. CPCC 205515 TaxID=3140791 RepID=UPI003AF373EF
MQWRWRSSELPPGDSGVPVRVRLTLLATAMVTLAFTIAAVALVLAINIVLVHGADAAASARATQIVNDLRTESITGLDHYLLAPARDVDVIQVLSADGHILATSTGSLRTSLAHPTGADPAPLEYRTSVASTVTRDGVPVTIVVGVAEDRIHRIVGTIAVLCCIVFPPVVLGMAILTHHLAGRSLRLVEELEDQVAHISPTDLHRRLTVPPTGDEIAALATTMNDLLERLDHTRTQQTRFVNDASHQLTEPLTSIVAGLEYARENHRPISPATVANRLLPDALRLTGTTSDLLCMARVDDRNQPVGQPR